ncbi:uncharacterized protein KGF55_000729 [Candida pseudojiufengensis]|uniref:uncharacterized protein n=1 Tax=Candida pseudojiufengensis TaxID=497109 RepID=UPI00222549D5|nr:uncharacterized protein KGF55_000729 [Candida pseudojiufengensis]KAI5966420.1 hypothetical protein KGF55_000729 [Candida pseudojiufengensis]
MNDDEDEFTIRSTSDYKQRFNFVSKYLVSFISFIFSTIFCTVLCSGAIIHDWIGKITGSGRLKKPDIETRSNGYIPRPAYDSIKDLKTTSDLQYYLKQLNLDLEEYDVTTPDGFILILHHIIDPKETKEQRDERKPVYFQHGLLSCSATFIVSGRNSLAYFMFEQGYDVWLGNNRSWFRAKHATIKGDLYNNEQYWDWSIKHLAYYDLPSFIETVLSMKPKHDKLILLGHSQGGLQSFLMLRNPNLDFIHEKIEIFVPIAPAIYPGKLFYSRWFISIVSSLPRFAWTIMFGYSAILRNLCLLRYFLCEYWIFGKLSYVMFNYLFAWNGSNWGSNKKIWHILFIFNMSYVSVDLFQYYLGKFNKYGFMSTLLSKEVYFNDNEVDYFIDSEKKNLEAITEERLDGEAKSDESLSKSYFPYNRTWFTDNLERVPILLILGDNDYLVDGKRLLSHFVHYEPYYNSNLNFNHVIIPTYNHLDVIWAEDVIGTVGYELLRFIDRNKNENTIATES